MNKKAKFIALAAGLLAGFSSAADDRDFNPVAEFLQASKLMDTAKADASVQTVCGFNSSSFPVIREKDRKWFFKMEDALLYTFYLCNALGYDAFRDNPYNDSILNPPGGKTPEDEKDNIRRKIKKAEDRICEDVKAIPNPNQYSVALCRARKP